MNYRTIGTCSLCGGAVTVPDIWHGIIPPTPTCSSCGAVAASHGPVIPMQPRLRLTVTRYSPTTVPMQPAPLPVEPWPPVNPWEVVPFDPPPNFPPHIPWWGSSICDHSVGGRFQA